MKTIVRRISAALTAFVITMCCMPAAAGITDTDIDDIMGSLVFAAGSDGILSEADDYAAYHGALRVDGAKLVDQYGDPIQLRGVSTHGLAWYPRYVSRKTFRYLRRNWNATCIRLALYTDEYGGYCNSDNNRGKNGSADKSANQKYLRKLVSRGVDYATDNGMYVIIDWHVLNDQNPLKYRKTARAFFSKMSAKYADHTNVIYEICNEPNGNSGSWKNIRKYANEIIPVIRRNDPDAVIIVGTPMWSQEIDKALSSPLKYDNVMYALHFYAGTHRADGNSWDLGTRMKNCIKKGLPVFISEFGICDASGNGKVDKTSAKRWKALIEKYNVSYICWNLSNKNESCAMIKSSCSKLSGWKSSELSAEGKWIRKWLRSE